ncbi:MAG: hypothetical protein KKA10_16285 [Euryarchaeota archaeon]|nr:hypothetical protein [Euryarchaeota archaeon]MCG2735651.1 hypothetical protein [Candidatus Methanoperedenaceae archaeon]
MEIAAITVDVISGNSIVIIQASGALLEKRLWMIPGFEVVPAGLGQGPCIVLLDPSHGFPELFRYLGFI